MDLKRSEMHGVQSLEAETHWKNSLRDFCLKKQFLPHWYQVDATNRTKVPDFLAAVVRCGLKAMAPPPSPTHPTAAQGPTLPKNVESVRDSDLRVEAKATSELSRISVLVQTPDKPSGLSLLTKKAYLSFARRNGQRGNANVVLHVSTDHKLTTRHGKQCLVYQFNIPPKFLQRSGGSSGKIGRAHV